MNKHVLLFVTLAMLSCAEKSNASRGVRSLAISEQNADVLQHIADYPDLEVLSITCIEDLKAIPESLGKLANLRELIIDNGNGCSMNPTLPESIGDLHSLKKLVLYGAQDPRDAGPQSEERHKFPKSMTHLKSLTYLDLGRNGFDEIPLFVSELTNLKELDFTFNMNLKKVPAFLGNLHELITLKLNANALTDLPDFLNTLPKLQYISLGNNCEITQDKVKIQELKRRFPKIKLDFEDEYDCPDR